MSIYFDKTKKAFDQIVFNIMLE